jgi:hypothetical protein
MSWRVKTDRDSREDVFRRKHNVCTANEILVILYQQELGIPDHCPQFVGLLMIQELVKRSSACIVERLE